jgi:BirA family biotin operon repressor/biotin-[acetyl-CoA-carboxylase] ligase
VIDRDAVRRALAERGIDASVEVALETDSTNDDAKAAAARGVSAPAVFLAEHQRKGRGRSGAAWLSRAGEGVLLSVLLRPRVRPAEGARVTLVVGLAVAEVLGAHTPRSVRVKWPNDVWIGDRKIAGILVEAQTRGGELSSIVVGVGVNVAGRSLPDEIASIATSLVLEEGTALDRGRIAAELVVGIVEAITRFEREGLAPFLAELRSKDALFGHAVRANDVDGVAEGIDDEGRLLVRSDEGTLTAVVAGHVERRAR